MSIYVVIGLILSLCAVFYILYYIKYYLAVYYKSKLESIIPIVLSLSEISSEILSKTGEIEDNNFEYKKFNESALTNIDNKLNNIMLEILKKDAKIVDYCTDSQIITIWSAMLNDFKNVNKINLDTIDDMKNLTKNYSLYRHIDALLMFIKGKTYDDIENKYKSLNVSRLFKEYIHANADKFSQLYTFLPDIIPLLDRERLKRRKIEKAE
jgi:hypothetical protein